MTKLMSPNTKVLACIMFVILASIINSEQKTIDMEPYAAIIENKLLSVDPSLKQILLKYSNNNVIMRKSATTKLPPLHNIPASTEKQDTEETVILQNRVQKIQPQISVRSYTDKINTDNSFAKYKQSRHKIGRLLKKEGISNKTKSLITDAFDKIINEMSMRCVKKGSSENLTPKTIRHGKLDRAARKELLKSWKSQFNKLINKYCERQDLTDLSGSKENIQFLSNLREFFFEMHSEFANFTSQYDLNCHVINSENALRSPKKFAVVRNAYSLSKEDYQLKKKSFECKFYIICDYELQQFLDAFYKDLQKAVDKIFNNYEAMYLSDFANEPITDKELFMGVIKDVIKKINSKFNETFSKETDRMDLDSSVDINEKVDKVTRFIHETIIHIKLLIDDVLTEKAKALPNKIRFTVKTDIMTTTDIEMSQIQEKFKLKMCESFEKCHGRETRRLKRELVLDKKMSGEYLPYRE